MRGILTFKELLRVAANITPENPATEEEREEAKDEAGVCACRVWLPVCSLSFQCITDIKEGFQQEEVYPDLMFGKITLTCSMDSS